VIDTEARRLNRFVANLLDMARVEAGALPMRAEATDLFDAVAGAIEDTRASLQDHRVEVAIEPDIPLVRLDPVLLHHCLINLLDNAGRYADPGTPIVIRCQRAGQALALSVIDQGPGIPAGQEKRVFETFTRLEGSDRVRHGTGLGLAIVKGFAEAMSLSVEAGNAPDGQRGACFTIRIPQTLMIAHLDSKEVP
jgi:two-component system sensor histidine kinase KdpD